MGVFTPALESMTNPNATFGPMIFKDYIAKHNLRSSGTAATISIDSLRRLDRQLRENDTMVFRLGKSASGRKGTEFGLAKVAGQLHDFFLLDSQAHTHAPTTFLPTASFRELYLYRLLRSRSETTLVSLAFASGLINHALGLDDNTAIVPAMGQSTFSFDFKPHSKLDIVFEHTAGQVEIDALFLGKRGGQDHLFIIEAKTDNYSSLAKHKLVYPILSLAPQVPLDIPIVGIYMRIDKSSSNLVYHVTECVFPDPRSLAKPVAINELNARKYTALTLPFFALNP